MYLNNTQSLSDEVVISESASLSLVLSYFRGAHSSWHASRYMALHLIDSHRVKGRQPALLFCLSAETCWKRSVSATINTDTPECDDFYMEYRLGARDQTVHRLVSGTHCFSFLLVHGYNPMAS